MSKDEKATRDRIHEIATSEFLDKGFRDASLRNIVKEAGVTTGSFYWYYNSKEELYDALVGDHYNHILQMYDDALESFWKMTKEEQKEHMGDIGGECMVRMTEYMYAGLLWGADVFSSVGLPCCRKYEKRPAASYCKAA